MVKTKDNKHLKIVSFDEEIITKNGAHQLLCKLDKSSEITEGKNCNIKQENENIESKRRNKNRKRSSEQSNQVSEECRSENKESIKEKTNELKRRKSNISQENEFVSTKNLNQDMEEGTKVKRKKKRNVKEKGIKESEAVEEISAENSEIKMVDSIRAQKRHKQAKLLEEKHLKAELETQQNALNYLSKWKHCRNEWKFEKLKQIWLQQSLFDITKIPDEFWGTAVEYFSNSKGFIRNVVLRDALKIIEEENSNKADINENYLIQRARDIVQHLQE